MACDVTTATDTSFMLIDVYVKEVETVDFDSIIGSFMFGLEVEVAAALPSGATYQASVTDVHGFKTHNV